MSVLASTSRNVLRRARANVRSCAASSATWHAKCIGYSWLLEPVMLPSRGLDRHRSISGCERTGRVVEDSLENIGCRGNRYQPACVRGRDGRAHVALCTLRLLPERTKSPRGSTAQPWEEHDAFGEHDDRRDRAVCSSGRYHYLSGL